MARKASHLPFRALRALLVPYQYAAPVLGNVDVIAVIGYVDVLRPDTGGAEEFIRDTVAIQQEVPWYGHDNLVAVSVLGQVQRHGS